MNKQEELKETIEILEMYVSDWNRASADEYPRFTDELGHACNFALSILQQQLNNRWIPVSEQLPDKGGYYLVGTQYETPRAMVGFYYTARNEWNYWMSQLPIMSVIAWQNLPEPYKEETE